MQTVIEHIFKELGGPTVIARETGFPVQTVHSWLGKANTRPAEIPPWRRPAVLAYARRKDGLFDKLSDEARAYLTSEERTVGKAAA